MIEICGWTKKFISELLHRVAKSFRIRRQSFRNLRNLKFRDSEYEWLVGRCPLSGGQFVHTALFGNRISLRRRWGGAIYSAHLDSLERANVYHWMKSAPITKMLCV
jgi:hypothetical protein